MDTSMVDEVKITNIDDNVIRRVDWARESTLLRLETLADQQVELLEKISGTQRTQRRQEDRSVAQRAAADTRAAEATRDLTDAIEDLEQEANKEWKEKYKARLEQEKYTKGLQNLRQNMSRLERVSPGSMFEGLTDKVAVFGGRLSASEGKFRSLGVAVTALSRAMTVASFGLGAFAAGVDPFRQMLDAGIAFGGSVEQMQVQVGRTGLGLQDFTRVALQYSQQISGIGDQSFATLVRSVQDTTRQFGRYGQSVTAQAESIGAFMEVLSAGGSLYMMTEEQRAAATNTYLREQTALTRLTGISRKRLEDEQKALAAQTNVQLAIREMEARGDVQGANQMRMMLQQIGAVMGPELASALTGLQMGIAPQDPAVRRLLAVSGSMDTMQQMAAQMRTMTPEEARAQAMAMRGQMATPDALRLLRIGAEVPSSALAGAAQLGARILGRTDVAAARTPAQLREVDEISQGIRGVLDAATTGYEQAAGDMARITGDLRSTVFTITQQLRIFSTALPALAGVTGTLTGLTSGLAGFVGEGVAQALAVAGLGGLAYGASRYGAARGMRAAAGTAAGVLTPLVPTGGAATPGVGTGAGARAAGSLGGLGRGLGAAGGLLGVGTGAYQAATAQDFGSRMMGIGTSALSGAAMGAMFGPIGAAIGGAAGLGVGLLSNLFGGGGAAAGAAPTAVAAGGMSDFATGFSTLNSTLITYLGTDGPLVSTMRQMIEINQQTERNTARIAANYN